MPHTRSHDRQEAVDLRVSGMAIKNRTVFEENFFHQQLIDLVVELLRPQKSGDFRKPVEFWLLLSLASQDVLSRSSACLCRQQWGLLCLPTYLRPLDQITKVI